MKKEMPGNCLVWLNSFGLLAHFYKFNREVQFLACHLMIGIKRNGMIILCNDFYREGLPLNILEIYLLSYGKPL